jgi:hypothetical protein
MRKGLRTRRMNAINPSIDSNANLTQKYLQTHPKYVSSGHPVASQIDIKINHHSWEIKMPKHAGYWPITQIH